MLDAGQLLDEAARETGLGDFGEDGFREGLDRLTDALETEGRLTELGRQILGLRLRMLLVNRLGVEHEHHLHPEVADEEVGGPLVIIGLPRTGTTALSALLALDPQIRSLRLWESGAPVPAPETATEHTDARIAQTEAGLAAMYEAFPRMKTMYFQTATGATECQDLLGMALRTAHFDGMAHVPSYTDWVVDCDMTPAYRTHRRVLQLLQWHCPPRLWHLKTPVHMLALDALADVYPGARFLWTHRDPSEVLGSVCSLVAYTRSWVSDHHDPVALGQQQVALWALALRRAMDFRRRVGEERFADIGFGDLNAAPVPTVARAYGQLGLELGPAGRQAMLRWSAEHPRGAHGAHAYALGEFGLSAAEVRDRFAFYLEGFDVAQGTGHLEG